MKNKLFSILTAVCITIGLAAFSMADEPDVLPDGQRACYNQPAVVNEMRLVVDGSDPLVNPDTHALNTESAGKVSNMMYITPKTVVFNLFSGISTRDFINLKDDLKKLEDYTDKRDVTMNINSPGGSAFDGLAIAGLIKEYRDKGWTIRAHAYSMVASAAVPIYSVCRPRVINPETTLMVHQAAIWKWPGRETSADIKSQDAMMDMLGTRYINLLVENSNLSAEEWKKKIDKTTWFTPTEAEAWGMVD